MAGLYPKFTSLDINSVRYDFHPSSVIGRRDEHVNTNGLRGTLEDSIERNLPGIYRVQGQYKMFPTPTELDTLMPIIFGASKTGVGPFTYPLGESATGYTHIVYRSDGTEGKKHTYASVKCGRSRWYCSTNSALALDTDWFGTTESEDVAAQSSGTIDITTKPWMFQQMTMTVDGTTVTPSSVEFTIDHFFDAERFFNSQTLSTGANWMNRAISIEAMIPYGDFEAIYTNSLVNTGVQVVITFTNGVYILTFTFVKVAFRKEAPSPDRLTGELMLPLRGNAFKSSTTKSLVTTLALS